jgi:hypothetical protein
LTSHPLYIFARKTMEKISMLIVPVLLITGLIILEIEKNKRGRLE